MTNGFKRKRVIITGANGFIGANLVKALEYMGADVYAFIREQSDLSRLIALNSKASRVTLDLLDYAAVNAKLAAIQPNFVFHTAVSRDYENWYSALELNVGATLNLVKGSLSPAFIKFVHCGSSLEYGDIEAPFRETDAILPNSLFGASKAAASLQLQQLALAKDIPLVILRIFHVYGILENEHRLVPTAIRSFLSNKPITLTEPGYCHDFIYVGDVVRACIMAAAASGQTGQIFNIGAGAPVTNEHVIEVLKNVIGKQTEIKVGAFFPRQWDKQNWHADISRSKKELNWHPLTNLKQGLEKCVDWHLKHA